MNKLMTNFILCQEKTDDKSMVLPEDINRLICQKIAENESRPADIISSELSFDEDENINRINPSMPLFKWLKNGLLHRECDLPAYIWKYKCETNYIYEAWWQNGLLSRSNQKPAFIWNHIHDNGIKLLIEVYAVDGFINEIHIKKIDDNKTIIDDNYDIFINDEISFSWLRAYIRSVCYEKF